MVNIEEANRIMNKYPDRIPIIIKKKKGSDIPDIDKKKYLVPKDMTLTQFTFVIRKRLTLDSSKALFFTINNKMEAANKTISDIYNDEKHEDGFLYIVYSAENTFG
jgi:GABA(A) receptor-associated protein